MYTYQQVGVGEILCITSVLWCTRNVDNFYKANQPVDKSKVIL